MGVPVRKKSTVNGSHATISTISGTSANNAKSGAKMSHSYTKSSCRQQPRSKTLPAVTNLTKRKAERLGPENQQAVQFLDHHYEQKSENKRLRQKQRFFFFSENANQPSERTFEDKKAAIYLSTKKNSKRERQKKKSGKIAKMETY